jgi:SAM-dependent methyltransferase
MKTQKLRLLPLEQYRGVNRADPIRFYYWPVIGSLYRKRVEMCLDECTGGDKVLEVGFGTGLSFLNLHEMYREIHGIDLTADTAEVEELFLSLGIQTFLRQGNILELPYPDDLFETVMLVSILEHLKPAEQEKAFQEIRRVLKPGGQVVYGVPVERPLMVFLFRVMGVDIRAHHYSTDEDVKKSAEVIFTTGQMKSLTPLKLLGAVYQVGHYIKNT